MIAIRTKHCSEYGLHDTCSGSVLKFKDETVERQLCECSCHGDPEQEYRRRLARGEYPTVRASRWAG